MPTQTYRFFAWAIENHVPLFCFYDANPRVFCPIILFRAGRTRVWQVDGVSSGPLPNWRSFNLSGVTGVELCQCDWETGRPGKFKRRPRAGEVDYDANRASPYHPVHSLGDLIGKPLEWVWQQS
jgi:hypothetical protein